MDRIMEHEAYWRRLELLAIRSADLDRAARIFVFRLKHWYKHIERNRLALDRSLSLSEGVGGSA